MSPGCHGTVALLGTLLLGCGSSPAGDNGAAFPDDAAPSAALGYQAVQSRQCAMCHQSPNPTDGVLSGQTTPVPQTQSYGANLTPDPDTGMDSWDAGTIAQSVLQAIDDQGAPLCAPMPAFGAKGMTMNEALSIAEYLQSLTPVRRHVPASICETPAKPTPGGGDGGKG